MNSNTTPPYRIEKRDDIVIVTFLHEVIDPVSVEKAGVDLPKSVALPDTKKLILDFTKMSYFPSRLLGVLLDINRAIESHGGKMRLCGIQPMAMDVLRFMRLDTVLKFDKDVMESITKF